MRKLFMTSIATALALALGACGSSNPTTTTAPTAVATTDTFSGIVAQQGSVGQPFTVTAAGTVTIGLTAVAPLTTMALGVGLATYDGTTCSTTPIAKNDNARAGTTALTGAAIAGSYCVLVYDSGNISTGVSVSYTVSVAHP
jgi:hypothetical protein